MELSEYQEWQKKTIKYPNDDPVDAITYCTLGLTGESGEVAEKIKKWLRDDVLIAEDVILELGDVLYYLARIADHLGYNMQQVLDMNVDKLEARVARNTIRGSGDNR